MPTYVLIHGAWHGGWCWDRLKARLEGGGVRVHTPTLTGLGDRAHLLNPAVDLETHVADVARFLDAEGLDDVVLVGHSYAGVVITAVADRRRGSVSRLIYLDAVVPQSGQCLLDCTGPQFRSRIEEQTRTWGDGWRIPPATPEFLGLTDAADISWVVPRLVPHPYRTFCDAVHLDTQHPSKVPRTFINCIGANPRGGPRSQQADGIESYYELSTGHDAMVTAPKELAELLRAIA